MFITRSISEYVHVDVQVIPPNDKRNFTTLVTMGMSDRPMNPPRERAEFRYAELLLVLPPEWPVTGSKADQWPWRWPADWLQGLARLPHRYNSWSFLYHTFSNGDPPKPYGEGINFVGGFLGFAASFHPDIAKAEIAPDKTVYFFAAIPVYAEEMAFKQQNGGEALARKLWAAGVHDRLDVRRKSVV